MPERRKLMKPRKRDIAKVSASPMSKVNHGDTPWTVLR